MLDRRRLGLKLNLIAGDDDVAVAGEHEPELENRSLSTALTSSTCGAESVVASRSKHGLANAHVVVRSGVLVGVERCCIATWVHGGCSLVLVVRRSA
jgi:hypothetical protein